MVGVHFKPVGLHDENRLQISSMRISFRYLAYTVLPRPLPESLHGTNNSIAHFWRHFQPKTFLVFFKLLIAV